MSVELFIDSAQNGGRIALLQDKSLVEFHYEDHTKNFNVGDIFLGTVKRIVPGLNAAFIDIGYEKDAFLHYLDLGPNIQSLNKFLRVQKTASKKNGAPQTVYTQLADFKMETQIDKLGKIADVLKVNQQILVQIVKEPISTKGPRLSCQLSLAGRYMVLVPFDERIMISRKISSKSERKRLQKLVEGIKPPNFGVIVRTMSEGKETSELERDLRDLLEKWQNGVDKLPKVNPRDKIIGEVSKATSMLRDMLNESFDSITVDDKETYESIKSVIRAIAPQKEKIVKLYAGKTKLFEALGIEKQIKLLFGKTVSLPSGGYLIIEHTEALHVIDVNSGNKSTSETDQESTALKVNMEAASEIARQLRLRDMGGIIVIDFIDMRKIEHKRAIYDHMKEAMKSDRSKYTILPLSKFGLMQITRQRVRPELNIVTREVCPSCNGTGKISASIGVADVIESKVDYLLTNQNESGITLALHPYLFGYFNSGIISRRIKWFFKYRKWVKMIEDTSLALNQFHIYNKQGQEIEL